MPNLRNITEVEEISTLMGDEKVLLNDHGEAKQVRADLIKPDVKTFPIVEEIKEGDKVLLNVGGVQKQADASLIKPKNLVGKMVSNGGEVFNDYSENRAIGKDSHAEGNGTVTSGFCSHAEGEGYNKLYKGVNVSNLRIEEKRFDIDADISKEKLPFMIYLYQNNELKIKVFVKEVKVKDAVTSIVCYERPSDILAETYDMYVVKGVASKDGSHAEGTKGIANAKHSHVEGDKCIVTGAVQKDGTLIGKGIAGHAEGTETIVMGEHGHSEGFRTQAIGNVSHAEGNYTTASGGSSHAEGSSTTASAWSSHAEGNYTTASGYCSHAEGNHATASGWSSHAEGGYTNASDYSSHAEGENTTASGWSSHAEGRSTTASGDYQHVQGKYNIDDPTGKYAHIVGNGDDSANSNAHTLDWQGNSWYQGSVLVGGTDMDAPNAEIHSDSVIIKSSTPSSTKRFKITIDDTGSMKIEEVIAK